MKDIQLSKLILTVFVISWLGVVPSLLIAYGYNIPSPLKKIEILMTLGPLLGAILFVYSNQGILGLKNLFKRLLLFKTKPLVVIVALLSPILISLLASFIGFKIFNTDWPVSFTASSIISNGLMISAVYLFINTEEIVWRGLVFDSLYKKFGFIKSCLILGPIWWLFHIPLFLYPGGHQAGYGFLEFSIIVIASTIILGWIYVNSQRSLVYVHLHHQLLNGFGQAFPIFPIFIAGNLIPLWVFCTLLLLLAVVLLTINFKARKDE